MSSNVMILNKEGDDQRPKETHQHIWHSVLGRNDWTCILCGAFREASNQESKP